MKIHSIGSQAKRSRPLLNVPNGLIKILDRDLATAGIAKIDDRKRSLDVHALRTTFGTMLSKAGVAPRTAQAAMRHSRIDLTMNVYTDPIALDIAGAVESLPSISVMAPRANRLRRTGTENSSSTVAPTVAPSAGKLGQIVSSSGNKATIGRLSGMNSENEKTLEIIEKTRVFRGVEDGTRTRDIRNHNPTL